MLCLYKRYESNISILMKLQHINNMQIHIMESQHTPRIPEDILIKLFSSIDCGNVCIIKNNNHLYSIEVISKDSTQIIVEVRAKNRRFTVALQIMRSLIKSILAKIFEKVYLYLHKATFEDYIHLGVKYINIIKRICRWVDIGTRIVEFYDFYWYNIPFVAIQNETPLQYIEVLYWIIKLIITCIIF